MPNLTKILVLITLFFIIAGLETFRPLFQDRKNRLRHGGKNIFFYSINSLFLTLFSSTITTFVFLNIEKYNLGFLNLVSIPVWLRFISSIILFDLWLYTWHRMNHIIPVLWRFHRMHHSDKQMDITTAIRFHIGEMFFSSLLRLPVIIFIGMHFYELVLYEFIMMPIIMLHHSNFYLSEKIDKIGRLFIVTPWMHWVHHSDVQPETDSNFGTIFPWWDRLLKTFRLRQNPETIQYGLTEFKDKQWHTISGMFKTPFVNPYRKE